MSKVVFNVAFDMSNIDLSQFTGGSVTSASSTEIDVASGDYSARVLGEGFDFSGNGTVHESIGAFQGDQIFDISGLNITLAEFQADRDNQAALIDDVFGGKDTIKGSNDKTHGDVLYGFGGNDGISGGRGDDTLAGGAGKDKLTGGVGADTFTFLTIDDSGKKLAGADLITDLDDANDHIDLTALHVAGKISASYDAVKDLTTFSIDVNGDHKVDMLITAAGDHHTFDAFAI